MRLQRWVDCATVQMLSQMVPTDIFSEESQMQFQFDPKLFLKAMMMQYQNMPNQSSMPMTPMGGMPTTQMPMSGTPNIGQSITQDIGGNIPGMKPQGGNSFLNALKDAIGKFDRQPQAINNQIRRPNTY